MRIATIFLTLVTLSISGCTSMQQSIQASAGVARIETKTGPDGAQSVSLSHGWLSPTDSIQPHTRLSLLVANYLPKEVYLVPFYGIFAGYPAEIVSLTADGNKISFQKKKFLNPDLKTTEDVTYVISENDFRKIFTSQKSEIVVESGAGVRGNSDIAAKRYGTLTVADRYSQFESMIPASLMPERIARMKENADFVYASNLLDSSRKEDILAAAMLPDEMREKVFNAGIRVEPDDFMKLTRLKTMSLSKYEPDISNGYNYSLRGVLSNGRASAIQIYVTDWANGWRFIDAAYDRSGNAYKVTKIATEPKCSSSTCINYETVGINITKEDLIAISKGQRNEFKIYGKAGSRIIKVDQYLGKSLLLKI